MIVEIQELYLTDQRPWVIGFSGGKDSTVVLQLIWQAIAKLPVDQREKPIYVISSDTLVENPILVERLELTIERINETAKKQNMPFVAQLVQRPTKDSFWVCLIGKGYPAPNQSFRWCTQRLKIDPSNRFIKEVGDCILVLGVRSDESITRKRSIEKHSIEGQLLKEHKITGVDVYAPIENWVTADVWTYLQSEKNPWGDNNNDLYEIYSVGDSCPFTVDRASGCGNNRFGCWTCTLIKTDKSMEDLINENDNNKWLIPLYEFRNKLMKTLEKRKQFKNDFGTYVTAPYLFSARKQLLLELLEIQKEVQRFKPELIIISEDEIKEIRKIWSLWDNRGVFTTNEKELLIELFGFDPINNDTWWATYRGLTIRVNFTHEEDDYGQTLSWIQVDANKEAVFAFLYFCIWKYRDLFKTCLYAYSSLETEYDPSKVFCFGFSTNPHRRGYKTPTNTQIEAFLSIKEQTTIDQWLTVYNTKKSLGVRES